MPENTHIFRAGDGSLRHRVDAYFTALKDYGRVEQSFKYADKSRDTDWLGDAKDLAAAELILKRSLARVTSAIDQQELREAIEQGMMTEEQAHEFAKHKQAAEFLQHSGKQKKSHSSDHGQKI